MTTYQYSATYADKYGFVQCVGFGSEQALFDFAVAIDREGGSLLSADREVYEVANGYAHLTRLEPYFMGKPQPDKALIF
jgi:hypothetical protein